MGLNSNRVGETKGGAVGKKGGSLNSIPKRRVDGGGGRGDRELGVQKRTMGGGIHKILARRI